MSSSPSTIIQDRLHLINGNLKLSPEQIQSMKQIREIISEAAYKMYAVIQNLPHDTGRLIAAIDGLQSAKNVACESILLAPGIREVGQGGDYRTTWKEPEPSMSG